MHGCRRMSGMRGELAENGVNNGLNNSQLNREFNARQFPLLFRLFQVCELNEEGVCKPGTKYGTKLVTQEVKPQDGNEDEEDAMD